MLYDHFAYKEAMMTLNTFHAIKNKNMKVETEYYRKLKIKKKQQLAFRRFLRGLSTPIGVREWVGMNHQEIKWELEAKMQPAMSWQNYGTYWVVDHVAPFWIFDIEDEKELKLLWHPENLLPLIWKDNNHKQGDLRFSLLLLSKRKGFSAVREQLIIKLEKGIKVLDKYLVHGV